MNLATESYEEPQHDRGIGRMIAVSAMLHAVVIGALVITGHLHFTKPKEPQSTAYEVTLVGPTGTGKRKGAEDRVAALPRSSAVEKPPSPSAKGEQRESLPAKQEPQAKPQAPQEKPKSVEPEKVKVKEAPAEKPKEVAKKVEPPKPKPPPAVQEKEPPKAVAAAKPVEKKPPPPQEKKINEVKAKEPVKPKMEARPVEKKETPKEKPAPKNEQVKVQEKKPNEVAKAKEPPKVQPPPSKPKPEKKPQETAKTITKEQTSEPKKIEKSEKADTSQAKSTSSETVKTPVQSSTSAADAAQAKKDDEARERMIASAVERVREREEVASRENGIAKAIDRVRQGVGSREARSKETASQSTAQSGQNKEDGDGRVAKAKVYGPEFLAYTESIKQKVKDGWIVPDRKPGLRAVVQFAVGADGTVADVELIQPSGDRGFDQSALRAVRNAKLPSPPEMYREDFITQKVHMTFGGEE
ncbi:MAG: TonB family protein [Deltaproteobacteria bacterium]|nr:TonB family protein [Deltaproteobacteria bacterium]